MQHEIKTPSMGESISEVTVSAILKPSGTSVKIDEELIELATDKVNQVIYAPCTGVFYPTVKVDDVIKIGDALGYIEVGELAKNPPKASANSSSKPNLPEMNLTPTSEQSNKQKGVVEFLQTSATAHATSSNLTPEEPASEENHLEEHSSPSYQSSSSENSNKEVRHKMSKIRQVIADRLLAVQKETVMLTTFNEVDMTALMDIRERYKEAFMKLHGVKLGLMSFFVKAAVAALKKFPMLNSYIDIDHNEIVEKLSCSIGVAVGTDKGVIVPVLKDCDDFSFAQIEKSIADYASQAKNGSISVDALRGASFTITNGGTYGSLLSTPIINAGQCAILGMHKIMKRPVVIDDQIAIRHMMYLALTYDHRLADGKEAVSFLVHIKNLIEDPYRLALDV